MTSTQTATCTVHDMKILAIDLGKTSGAWCDYHTPSGEHTFGTVPMTPQAVHDLLVERRPDRLVIEIGPSAGWIHDLASALEIEIEVANVNHEAWRWTRVKRKNDRADALKLAQLSAMRQLPTVYMPSAEVRQWRSLIGYRRTLVARRTRIKNTIRAILHRESIAHPASKSGWTKKAVAALEQMAWGEDGALWRFMLRTELAQLAEIEKQLTDVEKRLDGLAKEDGRVAMLKTAPCVGDRLAETVVAVIDDPHRFTRGRDVGCYVGLTPRQFQSGSMDRQGRISGEGNALLRSLLVEIAWLGVSRHRVPWMVNVYEGVRRGIKKRNKVAIVAVARRLLIRLWAMLRDGSPWRDADAAVLKLAA